MNIAVHREEDEEEQQIAWAGSNPKHILGGWPGLTGVANSLAGVQLMYLGHSWENKFGMVGPEAGDTTPMVRVLVSEGNPCTVLVELYSLQTLNMVDPDICHEADHALSVVSQLLMQKSRAHRRPRCLAFQGIGPHFCPGGNHHPETTPGGSRLWHSASCSTKAFLRFRELGIPTVTALHGTAIGGGIAITMPTYCRCIASNASISYGNLSRGAVALFHLTTYLPQAAGLSGALDYYLTDATFAAARVLKAGVANFVSKGIAETKAQAIRVAQALALNNFGAALMAPTSAPVNLSRIFQEAYCITWAGSKGVLGQAELEFKKRQEAGELQTQVGGEDGEESYDENDDWIDWEEEEEEEEWDEEGDAEGWWDEEY